MMVLVAGSYLGLTLSRSFSAQPLRKQLHGAVACKNPLPKLTVHCLRS